MKIKIYSIKKIEEFLKKIKKKKILIVTGRKSFQKSGLEKVFLKFLNKNWYFYYKKMNFPSINEVEGIVKLIKKTKPELIIAAGGGAVIDLAKVSNNLYRVKNRKKIILKSAKNITKNFCNLIAIPTTAGSGAEATSNAVVYINKKKYSLENRYVKPKYEILCPELVKNNNHSLKMSSGFDAIAQAVESLLSLKSNETSVKNAIKSLKLSLDTFPDYMKSKNIYFAKKMLLAANLSGKAINISRTTAPHAVSYPFTAHYGISHGQAVSITFNEFLKYNYDNKDKSLSKFNLEDRYKILFKLTNTQNISELDKYFFFLKKSNSIEDRLKHLGINISKNINKFMREINVQRLANNPVKLNYEAVTKILLNKY